MTLTWIVEGIMVRGPRGGLHRRRGRQACQKGRFTHAPTLVVLSSRNLVPGLGDLEGEIPPRAIEFGIIMWLCLLIPSLNINYLLFNNGISTHNHIIMKNNIQKYIRSRLGMPAVVKGVAFELKANVTADYVNIKYYFPEPMDQCRSGEL